jgi:hypothetical protein
MKFVKGGAVLLAIILILASTSMAADRMVIGEMFTNTL